MCHETAHFPSSCPILAKYTWLEKFLGTTRTFSYLAMVDPIPNNPMNHLWAAQVDKFFQGIHTCSRPSSAYASKTLQPIYLRYTGKALERREI